MDNSIAHQIIHCVVVFPTRYAPHFTIPCVVSVFINVDDIEAETGSYMDVPYPNMGLIDDDHELSKPRNQPRNRLQ